MSGFHLATHHTVCYETKTDTLTSIFNIRLLEIFSFNLAGDKIIVLALRFSKKRPNPGILQEILRQKMHFMGSPTSNRTGNGMV